MSVAIIDDSLPKADFQLPELVRNSSSDISADSPEIASIQAWCKKIKASKTHFQKDFDRMRENMAFVTGQQWKGQKTITHDEYVANLTLRMVNQKVATLYARNPKVEFIRRQRLDFSLWDGKQETLISALQQAQMGATSGIPPNPESWALINDYEQGKQRQRITDKVGETLKILYQYQVDCQEPEYKTQAKQLVRRTSVCGVGYVRLNFNRQYENSLSQSETSSSATTRGLIASNILKRVADGKVDENSSPVMDLQNITQSLASPAQDDSDMQERIVFDFPPATSIIVDPGCRALKGFVGARWIAEEYMYPVDFVNSIYQCDIKPGANGVQGYSTDGEVESKDESAKLVCLWEVFDLDTKSRFIVCDGYKDFLEKPEFYDQTRSFWPIFALTFNDVESEHKSKASIYPPSDVDLIKPSQKELNRTREALREQRKANAPKYFVSSGTLSESDKDKIEAASANEVIELQGLVPGTEPNKVIQAFQHAAIDPAMYDSRAIMEDVMFTTGQQEANIGPAQPNVTATVGTIAEQSRMTVTSSNVDDLDDFLSVVAQCGGELLLRNMSQQTVTTIVGQGAIWPMVDRESFCNEISLQTVASSSGRPNKAVEAANFQTLAPFLMQAGANPQAMIREAIKRLDDRLDPSEFFPLPGMMPQPVGQAAMGQPTQLGAPAGPPQPTGVPGQSSMSPASPVGAPQRSSFPRQ